MQIILFIFCLLLHLNYFTKTVTTISPKLFTLEGGVWCVFCKVIVYINPVIARLCMIELYGNYEIICNGEVPLFFILFALVHILCAVCRQFNTTFLNDVISFGVGLLRDITSLCVFPIFLALSHSDFAGLSLRTSSSFELPTDTSDSSLLLGFFVVEDRSLGALAWPKLSLLGRLLSPPGSERLVRWNVPVWVLVAPV